MTRESKISRILSFVVRSRHLQVFREECRITHRRKHFSRREKLRKDFSDFWELHLALVTSPSEHLDIIIILPLIDSLKQKKNNGDLAKRGFLPWRIDYKYSL